MRRQWWIVGALVLLWSLAAPAPVAGEGWAAYTAASGLPGNAITALAAGPGGELWAGATTGLGRFDGQRWTTYTTAQGLADNWVTALAFDAAGQLWCGTYGGGLSAWDGQRWRTYDRDNSGLASDWVTALAPDAQGGLWVGTLGGGISAFDGRSWRSYTRASTGLPLDHVTALAADAQGVLWVGTAGQGLCRLAGGRGACFSLAATDIENSEVTALAIGRDGRVWAGTADGLVALDPADGAWQRWPAPGGLPSSRVRALALDAQGTLWVGTGAGLAAYDGAAWRSYTTADGLPHPVISALAVNATGLWAGTLGGGLARLGSAPSAPSPALRPVVLVHGWRGPGSDRVEDSEFKFLRRWLERDGRAVFYATGISPDNTLPQNARALQATIRRAKAESGATQVDVIAFSMGGLNTRAYIESALYGDDVHQAIIMGTPHAGVTMWKTFLLHEIALWTDEPSARELLPEHVALFNQTHRNNALVPYHLYAGAVRAPELPSLFDFLPPSDGLISAWSAHALRGPAVRYVTTEDLHAWSDETMLLRIPSFLWPADTYDNLLRPTLREESTAPATATPPDWAPLPAEVHSPLFSGELAAGETATHTLPLEGGGTTRFYARWQRGSLDFALRDPLGELHEPGAEGEDVSYFELGFANFASYVITDTLAGAWTCRISAPEGLREPVGYAIYAVLDSPLRLEFAPSQPWYRAGEPVALRATLSDGGRGVAGASVSAAIYTPAHERLDVALLDDGQHGDGAANDGIYGNHWQPAGAGGYYPVFVTATGAGASGPYARGAEGVLLVSPGAAELLGTSRLRLPDDNGDGAIDKLELQLAIGVQQAGEFLLAAQLLDAAGALIGSTVAPIGLAAGLQWATLSFPGSWIRQHQAEGPYTVTSILLMDAAGAAVPLDQGADVVTPALRWQDFSP